MWTLIHDLSRLIFGAEIGRFGTLPLFHTPYYDHGFFSLFYDMTWRNQQLWIALN